LDALELLFTNCETDAVPRTAVKEQNLSGLVIMNLTSKAQQAVMNGHGHYALMQSSLCVNAKAVTYFDVSLVAEHILKHKSCQPANRFASFKIVNKSPFF
jgi:hypothetical protein